MAEGNLDSLTILLEYISADTIQLVVAIVKEFISEIVRYPKDKKWVSTWNERHIENMKLEI